MSLRCAINLCRFRERVIYLSSYYVEWRMQVSKGQRHCVTHTHNVPHSLHVIHQTHPANLAVYLSCNFSHLTLWCVSAAAALHRCQVATSSAEKLSQASEVAVHIAATWGWLKKCLVFFHIESHIKCETMQQNLVWKTWKTHCSLKAISPFIQQLYFFGGILDEWISHDHMFEPLNGDISKVLRPFGVLFMECEVQPIQDDFCILVALELRTPSSFPNMATSNSKKKEKKNNIVYSTNRALKCRAQNQ